jgi:glutamate synthase domain-containing protein 3
MNLQNRATVILRSVPRGTILVVINDPSADYMHRGYCINLALTTHDQRYGFSGGIAYTEAEALELIEDFTEEAYERAVRGGAKTTFHTMTENLVQATLL